MGLELKGGLGMRLQQESALVNEGILLKTNYVRKLAPSPPLPSPPLAPEVYLVTGSTPRLAFLGMVSPAVDLPILGVMEVDKVGQ